MEILKKKTVLEDDIIVNHFRKSNAISTTFIPILATIGLYYVFRRQKITIKNSYALAALLAFLPINYFIKSLVFNDDSMKKCVARYKELKN